MTDPASADVPVFLLKTKSSPSDAYEEYFQQHGEIIRFDPRFVPVIDHKFDENGISQFRSLLRHGQIGRHETASFGGLIFTSQRSVEAFSNVLDDLKGYGTSYLLKDVPLYSVGPATTRALKAVAVDDPLQVFGDHSGNGEVLSKFILEHYRQWYGDRESLPPIFFPVGEQRRDIIPKTLMDINLPPRNRIEVTEVVVYGIGVKPSFAEDLSASVTGSQVHGPAWVVVFSPVGCEGTLRGLGWLDETGRCVFPRGNGRVFVATIGPTTRDCLRTNFGFEPHVSAESPDPKGVWNGITQFQSSQP